MSGASGRRVESSKTGQGREGKASGIMSNKMHIMIMMRWCSLDGTDGCMFFDAPV